MHYSPDLNIINLKKIRLMLEDLDNPYVRTLKTARQTLAKNPSTDMSIVIVTDKSTDKRRYNKPTTNEVAILIPTDEDGELKERCGYIFNKNGGIKEINPNKSTYDSLQYPLMVPCGDKSWEPKYINLNLDDISKDEALVDVHPDIFAR